MHPLTKPFRETSSMNKDNLEITSHWKGKIIFFKADLQTNMAFMIDASVDSGIAKVRNHAIILQMLPNRHFLESFYLLFKSVIFILLLVFTDCNLLKASNHIHAENATFPEERKCTSDKQPAELYWSEPDLTFPFSWSFRKEVIRMTKLTNQNQPSLGRQHLLIKTKESSPTDGELTAQIFTQV